MCVCVCVCVCLCVCVDTNPLNHQSRLRLQNKPTTPLQIVKTLLTSVQDMTLNDLRVRRQQVWNFVKF